MDFKLKKHLSKYLNFHALVNNKRKYYLKTTTEILAIFWLLFPWKLRDEENITWNVFLKPPYLVLSYQLTSTVHGREGNQAPEQSQLIRQIFVDYMLQAKHRA